MASSTPTVTNAFIVRIPPVDRRLICAQIYFPVFSCRARPTFAL
jgi:hypothetical protein